MTSRQKLLQNLVCRRLSATSWGFSTAQWWVLCLLKTPQFVNLLSSDHKTWFTKSGFSLHFLVYHSQKRIRLRKSVSLSPWTIVGLYGWYLFLFNTFCTVDFDTPISRSTVRTDALGFSLTVCKMLLSRFSFSILYLLLGCSKAPWLIQCRSGYISKYLAEVMSAFLRDRKYTANMSN